MIGRGQRRQLLRAAERWLGLTYDHDQQDHGWRDLHATPTTFTDASFACRVAMDALGFWPHDLVADAGWLLEHLVAVASPQVGDLVGYTRTSSSNALWHVMIYSGNAEVIGACDVGSRVTIRDLEYDPSLQDRQWRVIEPPAFRTFTLRETPRYPLV